MASNERLYAMYLTNYEQMLLYFFRNMNDRAKAQFPELMLELKEAGVTQDGILTLARDFAQKYPNLERRHLS